MIDVAAAAKHAADQAAEADRRCTELTEMAQRAAEQAASVRDLAASLAVTASSVARVALDVCRYHGYQQAFEATTAGAGAAHRPPPIDLETFLSVVDNSTGKHSAVGLTTTGGSAETAAQLGVGGGGLGTCNEVDDETTANGEHDRPAADVGNDLIQSRHPAERDDDSTTTNDVTQLRTGECRRVADEGDEYLSSFCHSVSVPAMCVHSRLSVQYQ